MEIERSLRNIPFEAQPKVPIFYKDREMEKFYRPDFICYGDLIVEIKAEKCLTKGDEAQIINVLKCTKKKTGLLIDFGEPSLVFRRFAN